MTEKMVTGHTIRAFDEELSKLNRLVLDAAEKARDQLSKAVRSFEEEDIDSAHKVIVRDKEIDAMEIQADDTVFHIIARLQPVAKDLRNLLAVSKIMTDIERIGDEARRLARLTLTLYDSDANPPSDGLIRDIPKLVKFVDGMVEKAMRAFADDDARLALEVLRLDVERENEMKAALRRLSTYLLEDARSVGHVVDIAFGLRGIDRIGIHAAYIARHAIFLSEGRDVRHQPVDNVERSLKA